MAGTRPPSLALGLAIAALVAGVTTPAAHGQSPSPGATAPSDPVFTATRIDGSTASGQVRQLRTGPEGAVVLAGEAVPDREIPLARLVKLARDGASPPPTVEGGLVLFPDGDRLTRSVIGPVAEVNLEVQSLSLGNLAIPIDAILGLILAPPPEPEAVEALVSRVRSEPREAELLWLANGDKLAGLFAGMNDKKVQFQPATGKVEIDRPGVVALGFASGQVIYKRPDGPYLELTLVDGSRLGVTNARFDRGMILAITRFGSEIRLPISDLAGVHVLNASVTYLSDRDVDGTQYEAYIGPTRPYRRNTCVTGERLRLGGRAYDRGLGTQSRTLLAYKLEPGSKRFQAQAGLDDRAGSRGSVAFKVLVDNKVAYTSPPMTQGEPPRSIDIDLAGGRVLILITEFGDRGDVQDHADWVEARIIR